MTAIYLSVFPRALLAITYQPKALCMDQLQFTARLIAKF
ncbi:hypothetical protein AOT82_1714 [Psychrobacter sp. AntiMn-1]|nr:hypothetical protein AOT82_1714 [Psychrobacter sp. AntiMn-1]